MEADVAGEACFDLQKPIIGNPAGRVCITPFGEIRVEHGLLKAPIVFAVGRVQTILEASPSLQDDLPPLERDPVGVHLPRDQFTPANISFVFRSPVLVGPFKFGAQQLIPLRRSQRRKGLEVDVLALTMAEPALLAEAVRSLGVSSSQDVGASLARAIPRASPELEAEVHERRRRERRAAGWKVLGVGLLTAALIGARLAPDSWETMGRVAAASLSLAAIFGLIMSLRRDRPDRSRWRRWGGWAIFGLIALVALGAVITAREQLAGAPLIFVASVFASLLGGPVIGHGLRALSATRVDSSAGNPLVAHSGRRWGSGVALAAAAAVVLVGMAAMEESAARPIRDIQAALIVEDQLPSGWTECCNSDRILRGDSLDVHICGADNAALPAHDAAVERSFNKLTPGRPDLTDVHFDETVLLAPTTTDAEAEFGAVDSEGYVRCTSARMADLGRDWQSEATADADVFYDGRQRIDGLPGVVVDNFTISVPVGGTHDVIAGHFVRAQVGRAIVRMPILVFEPGSFSIQERDDIVRAALARIESADL